MILKYNQFINENQVEDNISKEKEEIEKLDQDIDKTRLEMKKKYLENLKKKKQQVDDGEIDINESYQDKVGVEDEKLEELIPLIKQEFNVDVNLEKSSSVNLIKLDLNGWEFKIYYYFDHETAIDGDYPEEFYEIYFKDDKGKNGIFDLGDTAEETIETIKHLMAGTYMEYLDKKLGVKD